MDFDRVWNFYVFSLQGHPSPCTISYGEEGLQAKIGKTFTNKESNVLVVGAADGKEVDLFKKLGYLECKGITLDRPIYHDTETMDMHNLSLLPEEHYDYVYSSHSFEHAFAPFIHCLEIWTVMQPMGKWYVEYPKSKIEGGNHPDVTVNSISYHHPNMLTKEQATQMFRATGFMVYDYKGDDSHKFTLKKIPYNNLSAMGVHPTVIETLKTRRRKWNT